mmetsp:Transcript_43887/g.122011  ORF Transcript_43887/g.122011 Transcript_43887/m.122011 type:complete len:237 (-) Transcript_43887:424-1134(-)
MASAAWILTITMSSKFHPTLGQAKKCEPCMPMRTSSSRAAAIAKTKSTNLFQAGGCWPCSAYRTRKSASTPSQMQLSTIRAMESCSERMPQCPTMRRTRLESFETESSPSPARGDVRTPANPLIKSGVDFLIPITSSKSPSSSSPPSSLMRSLCECFRPLSLSITPAGVATLDALLTGWLGVPGLECRVSDASPEILSTPLSRILPNSASIRFSNSSNLSMMFCKGGSRSFWRAAD